MKTKPNYELKAQILNNHQDLLLLNKACLKSKNDLYAYHATGKHISGKTLTDREAMKLYDHFMEECPEIWSECERINNATYARYKRLKNRIEAFVSDLNHGSVFLTFTFRDDVLAFTTEATRRRYITRYLKSQCDDYVANIDYGTQKDREHFHSVAHTPRVNLSTWEYGWIFAEPIFNRDSKRLALYVNKLTNHAIKATTKRNYGIYSKKAKARIAV